MLEWALSSAALCAVLIALRYILRGRIGLRLQYALWGLALLRLLLPLHFGSSPISVLNALPEREEVPAPAAAVRSLPGPTAYAASPSDLTPREEAAVTPRPQRAEVPASAQPVPAGAGAERLLRLLWLGGTAICLLWLAFVNLRFALGLRRSRRSLDADCPLPVYVSEAAETPCLFGLLHPAVYLPPEAAEDPALEHILAHEYTHFRHGDQLWSLLRGLALALHWFDPFVWWAALLSRRDGELACDEGALRRLGEEARGEYGRTLIRMTCARTPALFRAATTMTGGKGSLRERVRLIAQKPKTAAVTLGAVVLIAALALGCTFTGAKNTEYGSDAWLTEAARPLAERYARENALSLGEEGSVFHSGDDRSAEVFFPVGEGDRAVRVGFIRWDNGKWRPLDYEPADLAERGPGAVLTASRIRGSNPREVLDLALAYTRERLAYVTRELGLAVTEARVTGFTPMGEGIAGLTEGSVLYLLEYRFRLAEPEGAQLPQGMRLEGDELTEWTERGQPYLLLHWELLNAAKEWSLVRAADTLEIFGVRDVRELAEDFEKNYVAISLEQYLTGQQLPFAAPSPEPTALPETPVTVSCGGASVSPYLAMRWAETWTGDGFLAADGEPRDSAIREHGAEIPVLRRDGSISLVYGAGVAPASPVLRIYTPGLELWETCWEEPEAALEALPSGTWWCSLGVMWTGRYIPEAERRESFGEDAIFCLEVPEEGIWLNREDFTLVNPGDSYQLVAAVSPAGTKVHWRSEDPHVAAVDETGLVTAVDHGVTTITASAGEATAECVVRVMGYAPAEPESYSTIMENMTIFTLPGEGLSPEEAAYKLAELFLEDLTAEDPGRTFRLTEYADLEVQVRPTLELDGETAAIYGLAPEECRGDMWLVDIRARFRYTGVISPIGPSEGDRWCDQLHQGSPIGFLLTKTEMGYTLQSRHMPRT